MNKQTIRQQIRKLRQEQTPGQAEQSAADVAHKIETFQPLQLAKQVAIYLTNDGELDTGPTINALKSMQCKVCLPSIHRFDKRYLAFCRYDNDSLMVSNKFGIPEPLVTSLSIVPLQDLDIIFMPLVAFDQQGNRIGMGGGFYDRTLALRTKANQLLVGLAYDFQYQQELEPEPWDYPLDFVITPSKVFEF